MVFKYSARTATFRKLRIEKVTISVLKNVTCSWIVEMIDHIKQNSDMITNGFLQPEILDAIHSHFTSEVDPC